MILSETLGHHLGYLLGILTALVSFIRGSRMFHPQGILYQADVKSEYFYSCALVRLSSAWWKFKEWPDVLGIAIRFSIDPPSGTEVTSRDQDLLFATVSEPWLTPLGPFLTNYKDFFSNHYYAVSPFMHEGVMKKFRLSPKNESTGSGTREERLKETVLEGDACFDIQELVSTHKEWRTVGVLKLERHLNLDQLKLRFNPFQNGLGIYPKGFIHHLRIGAYRMSQWARGLRENQGPDEFF